MAAKFWIVAPRELPHAESAVLRGKTTTKPFVHTTEPPVAGVAIDGAYRADESLVVVVTGYRWGSAACQGQYFAGGEINDSGELVVAVEEHLDWPSTTASCSEEGFRHVLTVPDARDYERPSIVDAKTGQMVGVGTNVDSFRPDWITQRPHLPDCGLEAEYSATYPNRDALACFRRAFDDREPAELRIHQFGDEGESGYLFFRILEADNLEVLEEQRPPADGQAGGYPSVWNRFGCTSFHFLDEVGNEADGRPVLKRNLFEQFGSVQSCVIANDAESGQSKGVGFVEVPKVGDAKAAAQQLNGQELDGEIIRVKRATRPRSPLLSS